MEKLIMHKMHEELSTTLLLIWPAPSGDHKIFKRLNFLISFWILLKFSLIYLISINFKLIF